MNAENSSLGDILEESDWDVNSDVAMATEGRGGALMKRSLQSEKEIRYATKILITVLGKNIISILKNACFSGKGAPYINVMRIRKN